MGRKSAERESRASTAAPWILGTLGAGAVGALASRPGSRDWVASLDARSCMPAGWVLAPLTATVLILLGTAAAIVWRERARVPVRAALALYVAELGCAACWPYFFFGARATDLAMLDLSLLWILGALATVAFWRIRAIAGMLLAPHLVLVTYAAALNLSLWLRNG